MTHSESERPSIPSALRSLKIGGRVRCVDDGVEGRILWANAVALKIRWDDGEQVTWRRDSLTDRPIEMLDMAALEGSGALGVRSETTRIGAEEMQEVSTTPLFSTAPALMEGPASTIAEPAEQGTACATAVEVDKQSEKTSILKKRKLTLLDAAAQVLAEEGAAMSCVEMIRMMAARGYWTSPRGKTPEATLHSAIGREVAAQGEKARFQKMGRGRFGFRSAVERL